MSEVKAFLDYILRTDLTLDDDLDTLDLELDRAKFFAPCRVYSKQEIAEINKRILKIKE